MSEKNFKVGIIGAGVIADFHAQALQAMEGAELVAVFARKEDKAQSFAQKYACSACSRAISIKFPIASSTTTSSPLGVM